MMHFSGHHARKRFGQHWLIDGSVLEKIIKAADLQSEDRVLEVGPGRGALTERLLTSQVAGVHAIELDKDLVKGLKERFCGQPGFSLKQGDILSVPLMPPDGIPSNKVVANIPYNITGPLLKRLLGHLGDVNSTTFKLLVILLQKEVADRILAKPGHSNFSALSVRLQLMANCKSVCQVPPHCFTPPPKVHSQVIAIQPFEIDKRLDPLLVNRLEHLLSSAFISRRKMLRNSLGGLGSLDYLEDLAGAAGVSLNQRPQEISPNEWLAMARYIIHDKELGR